MCSIVKEVLLALLNWEMEEKACFYDHIPALHQLTHLALQTGSEWVIQHFPSLCLFFSVAPCARHHKTAYASHTHDWILPQAPEQRERLLAEEELGWKPAKKKKSQRCLLLPCIMYATVIILKAYFHCLIFHFTLKVIDTMRINVALILPVCCTVLQ